MFKYGLSRNRPQIDFVSKRWYFTQRELKVDSRGSSDVIGELVSLYEEGSI